MLRFPRNIFPFPISRNFIGWEIFLVLNLKARLLCGGNKEKSSNFWEKNFIYFIAPAKTPEIRQKKFLIIFQPQYQFRGFRFVFFAFYDSELPQNRLLNAPIRFIWVLLMNKKTDTKINFYFKMGYFVVSLGL